MMLGNWGVFCCDATISDLVFEGAIAIVLPCSVLELKSWNSQVTDWVRTFLNAHTILSKPFFPCNIDDGLRSNSTANGLQLVAESHRASNIHTHHTEF